MAGLIYSTELLLDEPWIIDRSALVELSAIFDDIWQKLLIKEKGRIETIVQEDMSRYYSRLSPDEYQAKHGALTDDEQRKATRSHRREITLELGRDKTFKGESIQDALKEPALHSEVPRNLGVRYNTTGNEIQFLIEKGVGPRLRIKISPERDDLSKEIFVMLREWAYKYRSPWWHRIWSTFGGILWLPWLVVVLLSAGALITTSFDEVSAKMARAEAHTLIKKGISQNDLSKAIEILLRIESKYVAENTQTPTPTWYKWLIFAGGLAVFIAMWRPRLIIGIGKGAQRLEIARLWLKIVSISLPSLLFVTVLSPYLNNILARLFG